MSFCLNSPRALLGIGLALSALTLPATAQVQGAGASFPSKVYQRWAKTYEAKTGDVVAYKPTGSGDGVAQISARSVDFGGTDSPLSAQELEKRKLVQFPMLVGGIVPVVNLPGVGANKLVLSGEVLAEIMSGRIRKWNDARIAALNPSLELPPLAIVRVVRSDKSGTTDGFTRYLSELSPSFRSEVGASQLPKWPGEVMPGDGNDGVVQVLKSTRGGVAYVSYDRVVSDGLTAVRLLNGAGQPVVASEAGFRAAILDSDVGRKGDDRASLMNRPATQAWPITQTSFAVVDLEPADGERASRAMRFLYWCFMHGDDLTRGTGFAPLPSSLQARLTKRFASVKAKDGRTLHYMGY